MKLFGIAALLCLSLLTVGSLPAGGAGSRTVSGEGLGDRESQGFFVFEATGTPRRATGRIKILTESNLIADVKCLAVQGKRAALAGKLRRPLSNGHTHLLLVVEDHRRAQEPPRDTLTLGTADAPFRCKRELEREGIPITSGNIRVR